MNEQDFMCGKAAVTCDDINFYLWCSVTKDSMLQLYQFILESSMDITIHINSIGGNFWDAQAVIDLISRTKDFNITASVDGVVCSSAASILFACHTRKFGRNAKILVHKPATTLPPGEYVADELKETIEGLEDCTARLYDLLVEKSNKDRAFWEEALTDGEYTPSPQEALELGLIDEVM